VLLRGFTDVQQPEVVEPQRNKQHRGAAQRNATDQGRDSHADHHNLRPVARILCWQSRPRDRWDNDGGKKHRRGGEAHEEVVIPLADAIIHEGAVVVEAHDAVVTVVAVRCTWRSHDLARVAPSVTELPETLWHHVEGIVQRVASWLAPFGS